MWNCIKIDHFWCYEFWCAKEYLNYKIILIYCFPTDKGILQHSNIHTCNFLSGSYSLAKPKSIIFMRLPSRVRHKIFSGFKSKWIILLWWIYSIASQICLINIEQARSVKRKFSSKTLSKSSPPSILWIRDWVYYVKEENQNKNE